MKHVLGEEIGELYAQIHRDEGVAFELGSTLEDISEGSSGLKLKTSKGVNIDCDLLVVGIGLIPNVEFLDRSGVEIDNGIVVDEYGQTNVPGIYAAGDVANHWHPLFERRMRVEHHDNALQQAAAAMNTMLGDRESYRTVHWVWSDQYDYNMQFAGSNLGCDQTVIRGSLSERKFAVFYLLQGQLKAVLGVNNGRDVVAARRLIAKSARMNLDALGDQDTKLKDAALAD
jgi:3-phenylpropionate/trans-cinnamate dioxygenase ferredoxin reductase subunit